MGPESLQQLNRSCGKCNVCCVCVSVAAFNKPADVPCQHLTVLQPQGCCGIYDERPSECKAYECAWKEGWILEELKPDSCGIMLEHAWIEHPKRLNLLMGFENRQGAMEENLEALDAAAKNGIVIGVVPFERDDYPTYFGEEQDLEAWAIFVEGCKRRGKITHKMADGTFDMDV